MPQESPPDVQTETSADLSVKSDSETAPPSEEPTGDVSSSAVQTESGTSEEPPQPQGEAAPLPQIESPQPSTEINPPSKCPSRQPPKTMKRKGGAAPRKSNKTELYIKSIKSLEVLFGNQMWRGIIVDPEQDPRQLYTPRSAFEERFVEVEFRNAMKAATRVVAGFGGQIRELRFDERTIADAMGFPFPKVGGIENPDERQIAEKCDKKMSKRIEQFATSDEVKRLLMHTGSRLGTFVPGLEIIARIYLGLKKGGDMDPQVRMTIAKDVVFKYQKVYFSEEAARKARNVALRFFFEHLVDYGLEVYKERKTTILETKTQEMDVENRLESLQEVCGNLAAERASKAVLSAAVIVELREHIKNAISDFEKGIDRTDSTDEMMSEGEGESEKGSDEQKIEGTPEKLEAKTDGAMFAQGEEKEGKPEDGQKPAEEDGETEEPVSADDVAMSGQVEEEKGNGQKSDPLEKSEGGLAEGVTQS